MSSFFEISQLSLTIISHYKIEKKLSSYVAALRFQYFINLFNNENLPKSANLQKKIRKKNYRLVLQNYNKTPIFGVATGSAYTN